MIPLVHVERFIGVLERLATGVERLLDRERDDGSVLIKLVYRGTGDAAGELAYFRVDTLQYEAPQWKTITWRPYDRYPYRSVLNLPEGFVLEVGAEYLVRVTPHLSEDCWDFREWRLLRKGP